MTQPIADPAGLAQLARRHARQLSFHLVLLGLACLVAAALLNLVPGVVGVVAALVVVVLAGMATGRLVASHPGTLRRWQPLVAIAGMGWVSLVLVLFVARLAMRDPSFLVWGCGLLGLLDGLVFGHLVFHGAGRVAGEGPNTRTH